MSCVSCISCCHDKSIIEFLFHNQEDGIKQIEDYYSNKFNIKIKNIGNIIKNNKSYFILCDTNNIVNLHIRYKIKHSFFGEKFLIYDKDYFINTSV